MAQIREELILSDKFSGGFTIYINLAEQAAKSTTQAQVATNKLAEASTRSSNVFVRGAQSIRKAALSLREYFTNSKSAKSATDNLTSGVRRLASQMLGLQAIKGMAGLSENLTSIKARLDMMNDGLQTTDELNQMIMESANRTGGSYQDTADLVGKLGVLAGNAFSSSAETVAFAEQVNKLMAISGTSAEGASAAMLQLTQAMASGVLRGEELNSVLEQAPTIAQTIAKYLGVNTGELRNMASEGKVTSDVVKSALLSMADETNAMFEQMPLTFSRIGNMAGNAFISAFQPAIDKLNEFLSSDTGQEVVDGLVAAAELLGDAAGVVIDIFTGVTEFIANNFTTVVAAASIVVAALTGYFLAMAAAALIANWPIVAIVAGVLLLASVISALGISGSQVLGALGGAFGTLAAIVYNVFAIIYNVVVTVADFLATVFNDPIAAIVGLFAGLADAVLSVLSTIAGAIDALFGSNLQATVEGWRSGLADAVDAKFGDRLPQTERMELMDVAATAGDMSAAFSDFGSGMADMFGTTGGADYASEIADNTASTAGSAGSIEKSLGLAEEDLKSLVDVAEQRYVAQVNLTAQTPVITVYGQNTGNTPADRQALADGIRDILLEQMGAGSSTASPFAFSRA